MEIKQADNTIWERNEEHREGRLVYNKTNFEGLRKYFRQTNWKEFFEEEVTVDGNWNTFMEKYMEWRDMYQYSGIELSS